uniref:Uncharacterized protein n=1 Tax=Arundo donax TaxID=35708 RepID=A0A0A8YQG9_ARUDO
MLLNCCSADRYDHSRSQASVLRLKISKALVFCCEIEDCIMRRKRLACRSS